MAQTTAQSHSLALIPHPRVIEMNGRPVRARTADLHRVKVAL